MTFQLAARRLRFKPRITLPPYRSLATSSPQLSNNPAAGRLRSVLVGSLALTSTGLLAIYYFDSRAALHRYVVGPVLRTVLDAEQSHQFALRVLRSGWAPRDMGEDDELLRAEIWGEELLNPIGMAAGFDKDGEAIDGLFNLGFGWVEIGSVTPKPQPGNPQPRVFRLSEDEAVINRYGFPSKGHIALLARLRARLDPTQSSIPHTPSSSPSHTPRKMLSLNLGKNKSSPPDSVADFLAGIRTFGPFVDVLVINVSSPNTPGLRQLQSRGMLSELLGAVMKERDALGERVELHANSLPKVLVKIAPDLSGDELQDIAEVVKESRVDGLIVANTTVQRPPGLESDNAKETGGLSGPPVKPLTLKALRTLRDLLPASIPIIGAGGISTGADALEYAKAGASAVQIYTSFGYGGVGTPRRIKDELVGLLKKEGKSWKEVVREVNAPAVVAPPEEAKQTAEPHKGGQTEMMAVGEELMGLLKQSTTEEAVVGDAPPAAVL